MESRHSHWALLVASCCPVAGSVRGSLVLEVCGDEYMDPLDFLEEDRVFFIPSKSKYSIGTDF